MKFNIFVSFFCLWHAGLSPLLVLSFSGFPEAFNVPISREQVVQRFQELFAQTKYKEAAELAADSPQGILRTPDTVAKFQVHLGSFSLFLFKKSKELFLC